MIKSLALLYYKIISCYWHQPKIFDSLKNLRINYIFDVGSHKGESIDYFIELKNLKIIHSFEPQNDIFFISIITSDNKFSFIIRSTKDRVKIYGWNSLKRDHYSMSRNISF